jgi:DNA polymerase III epsilon subunit-like protein
LTRDDWVLVDTETTGLDSGAEVIDLAVLDRHGTVLLETLLRPRRPIPAQVTRIHGLGDHHVRDAPTFAQIWPRLGPLLAGRTIIAYNVAFDRRLLAQTATNHGVTMPTLAHECAMRRYVEYRNAKGLPGGHGSYSLEKACRDHGIPIGGHRAASDCRATLALMRVMAR